MDRVLTTAVRIVVVLDERPHIPGLREVVRGRITHRIEGEVLPDEALVVPLVEESDGLLGSRVEEVPVVESIDVVLLVGDLVRDERRE